MDAELAYAIERLNELGYDILFPHVDDESDDSSSIILTDRQRHEEYLSDLEDLINLRLYQE